MQIAKSMVSVIIPNYNHAPYLQKRIDSVLDQSFQDFEVIILDDNSTDESRKVIENYRGHSKVSHIVFNETNSGSPFIQWQKGFHLAKGEYIWIAESDDYADTHFLDTLLPAFTKNESVGIVYSDSNIVDSEGVIHLDYYKKHRNTSFKSTKWDANYIKSGVEEIKENLFFECTINNTSAMVFKKSLLQYVDFEKLRQFKYCGDWFFFIALISHCDIAYEKQALSFFKYGTNNFKNGAKSTLNYLKERSMVRYYFWKSYSLMFDKRSAVKLFSQLGQEMKIIINETIKGEVTKHALYTSFRFLWKISPSLFRKQISYALKLYIIR